MINIINEKETIQAKLINPMIDYYENFYKKEHPGIGGSLIHDLLPPKKYEGKSIADFRKIGKSIRFDNRTVQRVVVDFSNQAFKREFMRTMLKPDCS